MGMRLAEMKKHFDKTSKVFRNLAPHVPEDVGCDEYADHCDAMSAKCDKAMEDEMNKLMPTRVHGIVPPNIRAIPRAGQREIASGEDLKVLPEQIFGKTSELDSI
jgi:hypothetical protein